MELDFPPTKRIRQVRLSLDEDVDHYLHDLLVIYNKSHKDVHYSFGQMIAYIVNQAVRTWMVAGKEPPLK